MDTRLKRLDFLSELVPMQGVVERRTTIPVLSHILLRASDERLYIAATDLEVSLTSWCDAEIAEEGAIAIQAKKLVEIVKASSGESISLKIEQDNQLQILVGKSIFKIRGLPAEEFPTLPNIDSEAPKRLPFSLFRSMVTKVFYAISNEESRFQLSGALLEFFPDRLLLVATDGHRLALAESNVPGLDEATSTLVPRKALQELQRFEGEDLSFRSSEHHLSFGVGKRHLICRILEGTFPEYERVISKDNDKHVVVNRQLLAAVINRVGLLTGDRARAIRLKLVQGQLVFSAANPDLGEAREEVACEYEGQELVMGINPDYFGQFLAVADTEEVRLELKDENSQCVVYPVAENSDRYVCVIMPIRL